MKSLLLIALLRLLALLPLRVARALGVAMADVCWLLRGRMARTTQTNLALCLPQLDAVARDALAKLSLRHTFMAIAECGAVWLWPAPAALALISRVEGLDLLRSAHAAGRGVIMLGPHLGNWELTGLIRKASASCSRPSGAAK